ncbi:hypothetical protein FKW77_001442 [Venturia effusa]|uniref:Beta-xylanase n=1 Tax=Venturia effusa TaxID=50376 RepID=A0A517LI45_9PEZI|nr:hypothetical protein FKW77_001442 [Venturia effusa]
MLFVPRIYEVASKDSPSSSPFLHAFPPREEQKRAEKRAREMLLVHQTGSVKVGEVVRYTLTYEPSQDRILPSPSNLHVRIKNTSAIALRAAYLHGPYTLHVATYPSTFNPNSKLDNPRKNGVPQFEPNLKAGGTFTAKIPVPEDIRVTGHEQVSERHDQDHKPTSMTWIIEVTSQILFSSSASVNFEVLVSRDERSLDYNLTTMTGPHQEGPVTGQLHDHQQGRKRHSNRHGSGQPRGVHSKAVRLVIDDLESLWNKPELPKWEDSQKTRRPSTDLRRKKSSEQGRPRNRKKKRIHLVILTHGLHSNLGADMLYMKESIDATARQAREDAKRRRRGESESDQKGAKDPSTAPLSGGQEDLHDNDGDADSDDDEQVIVRGYSGNAVKTENGIQYLGKRLAKYILDLTYPDQPYKPLRKSMTKKLSDALSTKPPSDADKGKPSHDSSTIRQDEIRSNDLAYTFTSISFIGHSLGGLVQLYAIGYIQKHAPAFFAQIEPINFICLASPLLGLSNENPMYVKFALDFGLVGRTGQDLGLTWRPTPLARTGWAAMMGGLGTQKEQHSEDPGSKPLLRVLPTGPAHRVLRRFRNRTLYSNVVNDGIVPLRTSCLLFLDWRGLDRVGKARRENGILGTMAGWGWAEITGQSTTSNSSQPQFMIADDTPDDSDTPTRPEHQVAVPQPDEDATNKDDEPQQVPSDTQMVKRLSQADGVSGEASSGGTGTLDGLRNFLGLTAKTTKRDLKMYKRSQTIKIDNNDEIGNASVDGTESPSDGQQHNRRPLATRGDTIMEDPTNSNAPPKTSIFESAGDILNPPIPPTSWIIDPSSRTRTVFHDRVYHPEDIPPPPMKRPKTGRSISQASLKTTSTQSEEMLAPDLSSMRVEERIARAYHKDLSWRKVLVRLEPDAHNNMIVRRMFANAYGWPVVKHLCDTHFGDTYAARTRDEDEPATDRAKGIHRPVGEDGEHVKGQNSATPPPRPEREMRESADELRPLKVPQSSLKVSLASPSRVGTASSIESFDSRIFDDNTDDEDNRGIMGKLWPQGPRFGESTTRMSSQEAPSTASDIDDFLASSSSSRAPNNTAAAAPEIADVLTTTPPALDEDKSLDPAVIEPGKDFMGVGLRKSIESLTSHTKSGSSSAALLASLLALPVLAAILNHDFLLNTPPISNGKRYTNGLNDAAKAAGKLYFGTATDPVSFGDEAYMRILNSTGDFGSLSVENAMKWEIIHPDRFIFDWAAADQLIALAQANGQLVRCHTLLWHLELPAWLESGGFDNATLTRIMKAHVISLVQHFRGRCYAWDVVNEPLNDDGTIRDSIWSRTIGPSFIPIAFKAAAKADPLAKLYLNEFDIENDYGIGTVKVGSYFDASQLGGGGQAKEKRQVAQVPGVCKDCGRRKIEGLKEVVQLIRAQGARIDGIGFQSHFEFNNTPSAATLGRIMNEFTRMDLDVAVTELDVRMDVANCSDAAQWEQAAGYQGVVGACRSVERCKGVTVWEFSDYWGWTSVALKGWGSALPWDSVLVKKQWVFNAILAGWNG